MISTPSSRRLGRLMIRRSKASNSGFNILADAERESAAGHQ